jgi:hypothetical protein
VGCGLLFPPLSADRDSVTFPEASYTGQRKDDATDGRAEVLALLLAASETADRLAGEAFFEGDGGAGADLLSLSTALMQAVRLVEELLGGAEDDQPAPAFVTSTASARSRRKADGDCATCGGKGKIREGHVVCPDCSGTGQSDDDGKSLDLDDATVTAALDDAMHETLGSIPAIVQAAIRRARGRVD